VFVPGSQWRRFRRVWDGPLLQSDALAGYMPGMAAAALKLRGRLERAAGGGTTVDLWRLLGGMTMEVRRCFCVVEEGV
jgi:thromboxane-A synthase/cytochrome P450 family 3 subfamily A